MLLVLVLDSNISLSSIRFAFRHEATIGEDSGRRDQRMLNRSLGESRFASTAGTEGA
ncbi:hypothetical protein [Ramlibacter sp. AN1133]|uniref:hypothetical protein n=1 Tax=Ramlibacter sp. AN1133 TaxID=3133429 RepID=UPI0030C3F6F2